MPMCLAPSENPGGNHGRKGGYNDAEALDHAVGRADYRLFCWSQKAHTFVGGNFQAVSQSSVIAFYLLIGFVVYITMKGELSKYVALVTTYNTGT